MSLMNIRENEKYFQHSLYAFELHHTNFPNLQPILAFSNGALYFLSSK